jgi:hypothetical protein
MDPQVSCDDAARLLVAQFGAERGSVSAASLKRIWKAAGLEQPRGGYRSPPREDVQRLTGGGGLALVAAAVAETGVTSELGEMAVAQAKLMAAVQAEVADDGVDVDVHRDERGRFTASYNRAVRGDQERDPRWDSDAAKRRRRCLDELSLVSARPELVGDKFLTLGASMLLTEQRGFDGLSNFNGAWLAALGVHPYMPATLDKFLAELALVDAGDALWTTHGRHWQETTAPWCTEGDQPRWLRNVVYVDATQDPYWTRHFAVSGKVSRVGRVMPCITRVAVMGGPGVPLVVDTHAGSVRLEDKLLPLLDRMEGIVGDGELGRLTVVDAEMATTSLLRELAARPDHWFVSVLENSTLKSSRRHDLGDWQRYRDHDLVRDMTLRFGRQDDPTGVLTLRGVEMIREGSRNPTSTLFVTNATPDELPVDEVPTVYLSRWPNQEQRFRDGRNGIGLERSHGYGGEYVQHVALSTKLDKAQRSIAWADRQLDKAREVEAHAQAHLDQAQRGTRTEARQVLAAATKQRRAAERNKDKAQRKHDRLASMPREIYVRDTTRDGIATCAKLTLLMLVEFVLKEYFGGLRMEPRNFIETFNYLPVTIRRAHAEVRYELHANPRDPKRMEQLRAACAEASRRELRDRNGKRMCFVVIDDEDVGLSP